MYFLETDAHPARLLLDKACGWENMRLSFFIFDILVGGIGMLWREHEWKPLCTMIVGDAGEKNTLVDWGLLKFLENPIMR